MNLDEMIHSATRYMEDVHRHDYSGHDVAHVHRVTAIAQHIARHEQITQLHIVTLAALLHDCVDEKLVNSEQQLVKLKHFLTTLDLSEQDQQHILHIILNMSYRNGKNNRVALSLEGQVVRDADRLDAIGAIGIARTFQFAGFFKEPMWTEDIDFEHMSDKNLEQLPPSAIKHFYEKLLKLQELMHTSTAKRIAKERHDFMLTFLEQFFKEWNHLLN